MGFSFSTTQPLPVMPTSLSTRAETWTSRPFFGGGTATAGNATITTSGTDVEFHDHGAGWHRNDHHYHPLRGNEFFRHEHRRHRNYHRHEGDMNFFNNSSAGAASIHVDGTSL